MIGLGRWGSRAPFPGGDAELGTDAFVIALKTLFDPAAAGDLDATVELRLGDDRFRAAVEGGRFDVARGEARQPGRGRQRRAGCPAPACSGTGARSTTSSGRGRPLLLARFLRAFPAAAPA